jgi:MFS family permease
MRPPGSSFATGAQLALHGLLSRRAMLIGFGWLMAGLLLVMLGLSVKELWVFVLGTIACGIGVGLVIMGALAMVNRIAPPDHRGETLSTLFVAAYVGMSVPAIGVGLASEHFGFFRSTLVCSIGVALLLVAAAVRLTSRRLGPSAARVAP